MKKRFTRILAALALLAFMTPSMVAWGQTREEVTLKYTGSETTNMTGENDAELVGLDAEEWSVVGGTGAHALYPGLNKSGYIALYYNAGGSNTITVTNNGGNTISSIAITYSGSNYNNGKVFVGDNEVSASNGSYAINANSFVVTNGNTSNTQVRISQIVMTLDGGSTPELEDNDLALTGAPVALTFDLYNNNAAQVINYTTSSTGTVSVASNNFVSATVDQTAKTITVTPTAMTNGAQTITVNQAADNNYEAGSTTFTVDITDSTPGSQVVFTAGTEHGTSTGQSADSMTKDGVTVSSTSAALNQNPYRIYASSITTISVAAGYTITKIVINGAEGYNVSGFTANVGSYSVTNNIGTWTGNISSIEFTNGLSSQIRVTSFVVTVEATSNPTITVTPTTLESFISFGEDPSEAQTISVSGVNLTHNITVASVMNDIFEISLAPNSGYTNSLTLNHSNGTVDATTIYVRMKGGLEEDEYNGMVNIISEGAVSQIIEFTGNAVAPMTVAEAIEAIDAAGEDGIENAYVSGIVCQIDNYNSQYHSITYWISDDGEPSTMLQVFSGKGLNGANFNSEDDLMVGDQVVVNGDLQYFESQGIYEFNYNSIIVYLKPNTTPLIVADNLTMAYNETSGEIEYTVHNAVEGTDLEVSYDATWIYDVTVSSDKISFKASQNDTQEARTTSFILMYEGANDVYVDITQEAYTSGGASGNYEWVLADLTSLTSNDVFVIVGDNGNTYAMKNEGATNSGPVVVAVTVDNDKLTGDVPGNIQWNISGDAENGYIFYPNGSTTTWLYCTSNNNGLRIGTGNIDYNVFKTVDDYLYNIGRGRYIGIYNSTDWRSYTSINSNIEGQTFAFYKRVEVEPVTKKLSINGYGEGTGNYYLIATPFVATTPTADNGFLTNAFDLYRFDQVGDDEGKEWLNYEVQSFNLLSGHGYLYASEADTELTFSGETYNGDGKVTLSKVSGTQFEGMNLIGNPWATNAVLKDANGNNNRAYYKMNDTGSKIVAGTLGDNIAAMTGVFVSAESDGEEVTFTQSGNKSQQVCINLNSSRSATIDRAIVRFDGGDQLPKFQLFENSTKIYVTEGNKDYAVVRSAAEAEMPVSFRASENGTYTLAVEAENVEMNYLHLIDNLTGMDVDLLQTPSYTFEAKTSDYASRFRLVFKANGTNENNAETFAYFNGTNWTVSNVGDATLQVVDVTGRTVANQMINGNAELNLNQPAGVYVIRLVNGDNVKTQKVVVR